MYRVEDNMLDILYGIVCSQSDCSKEKTIKEPDGSGCYSASAAIPLRSRVPAQ